MEVGVHLSKYAHMLRLYDWYVFKYDMICLFINQFQLLVRKPQFEGVRFIVSFKRSKSTW